MLYICYRLPGALLLLAVIFIFCDSLYLESYLTAHDKLVNIKSAAAILYVDVALHLVRDYRYRAYDVVDHAGASQWVIFPFQQYLRFEADKVIFMLFNIIFKLGRCVFLGE